MKDIIIVTVIPGTGLVKVESKGKISAAKHMKAEAFFADLAKDSGDTESRSKRVTKAGAHTHSHQGQEHTH